MSKFAVVAALGRFDGRSLDVIAHGAETIMTAMRRRAKMSRMAKMTVAQSSQDGVDAYQIAENIKAAGGTVSYTLGEHKEITAVVFTFDRGEAPAEIVTVSTASD